MLFAIPKPPALTLPSPITRPRAIIVKWGEVDWPFWGENSYHRLRRYPSSADAIADTNATLFDNITGQKYRDEEAPLDGVVSWYRHSYIDDYGNESELSSPVSETNRRIETADLDETAPGVPTGLAVTQLTRDTDGGDGRVRINARATWNAPASGIAVRRYVIEVNDGENTEYLYTAAARRAVKIKDMVVGRTYNVKVSAESFAGTEGAQTSAVAITPTAKTAGPGNASAVSIVPKAKMNRVKWTAPSDKDLTGFNVYFNSVNNAATATLLDFTRATKYDDTTERAVGDVCYYFVEAVNRSGAVSASRVAASNNPQNARAANSGDLGAGAVLDAAMGAGRGANLLINTNANLGTMFWKEIGDANANNFLYFGEVDFGWAPKGERVLAIQQLDGISGSFADYTQCNEFGDNRNIPVVAGQRYELHLLTGANRCSAIAYIFFYNASNTFLASFATDINAGTHAGGPLLSDFKQVGCFGVAPATAAFARVIIRKYNTDPGASPANSYLFFTHLFFGLAGPNQSEYSPWAENGNLQVTDDMTDSRTRAAPSALTLTKVQEVDEDGTIRTYIRMACTAPAWASGKTGYEFEVTVSGNAEIVKSGNTAKRYRVNKTGTLHSVRVRGVLGVGTKGDWSGAVTITPSATTTAPPTATWEAANPIVAKPKGVLLRLVKPADADWLEFVIYRNTVNNSGTAAEIGRSSTNRYKDEDELTPGTTYYYWAKSRNTSGVLSAAFSTVQSVAYKAVTSADTDATIIGAPTGLALALNYQYVDQGDGTIKTSYKATWNAATGATTYELEVSVADTSGGTYTVINNIVSSERLVEFDVTVGKFYKTRVRGISFNNTPGAWSAPTAAVQPLKKSATLPVPSALVAQGTLGGILLYWPRVDLDTYPDYMFTRVYRKAGGGLPGDPYELFTETRNPYLFLPLRAGSSLNWSFKIAHVDRSGLETDQRPIAGSDFVSPDRANEFEIGVASVGTAALQASAVTLPEDAYTNGNYGTFGTSQQTIQTLSVSHGAGANHLFVIASFKNTSGSSVAFDVTLETGAGTVFASTPGQQVPNNGYGFIHGILPSPTGNSTLVHLRVTCSTTGNNVAARRINAISLKR